MRLQNGLKMAQDCLRMASSWLCGTSKIVLSLRRRANFAKLTPPLLSRRQERSLWSQDGTKMAQDGPKRVPRGSSEAPMTGAKAKSFQRYRSEGFPRTRLSFRSCACGLVGDLFLSPRSSSSSFFFLLSFFLSRFLAP